MGIKVTGFLRIYIAFLVCNVLAITLGFPDAKHRNEANTIFRRKRTVDCAEKYATITEGHSACLQRSPAVQELGVSSHEQRVIVDEHNRLRRNVYPPAKNMREMSWDKDIAHIAQKWAENCEIGHDPRYQRYDYGRFDVGQNLCWSTYKMSWQEAMGLWSNETKHYQYGRPQGATAVAHYTQIIWAETSLVGCGYAHCQGNHFYVCNYGPSGNYDISKPYESGQTCADCPYTCRDKLCDCHGKVCLNGGKMDLNTCTCTCQKEFKFYVGPYCELDCTDIKDPEYCSQQFGRTTCEIYSNVPQMCPDMCGWCPAAGKKFDSRVHISRQPNTDVRQNDTEHQTVLRRHEDRLSRTRDRYDPSRADQTIDRTQHHDTRRRPDHSQDTRREHDRVETEAQHQETSYKDSDLQQKVETIVEKQLTVKIEPLVHTYVSSVLKETTKDLELKNKNLLKEVGRVSRKYSRMVNDLDSLEQYSNQNTLRVAGVPETSSENTDEVVVEVAIAADCNIQLADIDYSHRAGKTKAGHPRDIIVRFVTHNAKERLYDARLRLAETKEYKSVTIHERLTRQRKKLLTGARKLVKNKHINKAWTQDGNVYILNLRNKQKIIKKESDLNRYKKLGTANENTSDNSTE